MNLNDLANKLWPFLARLFVATGTYTPTMLGGTTPGVTTYTTQYGRYTKIFDVVFFTMFLNWTAATGTGIAQFSIPFASSNTTSGFCTASLWHYDVTYAGTGLMPLISFGVDALVLATPTSNAPNANINVEASGRVVITGMYFV